MKIYIVTGNSYPAAAFKEKKAAKEFVDNKLKAAKSTNPFVLWEVKEFTLHG